MVAIFGSSVVLYLWVSVSSNVFMISSILPFGIVFSISGTCDVFWNFFVGGGNCSGFIIFPYLLDIFFSSPFFVILCCGVILMFFFFLGYIYIIV